MRTTITFADDVAALVEQRRVEAGVGISEVVNDLIRAGAAAPPRRPGPPIPSFDMGLGIDVSNIGEVLAYLDEFDD